jgi:N-acetylneuraminic acid mutarotase/Tfp pilus assembly protein PilX
MRLSTFKFASFKKSAGFTLLPVVLAMSLIAAIAFLINRDNGMNTDMVVSQMDADRARYAAEAGLQAANAKIQTLGCTGGYPVIGTPVTNNNFGGASYSGYASASFGNTTNLVSTGTYNGTTVTLTRNNVYVYQSAVTYTLQPNATGTDDTYIDSAIEKNYGSANSLPIKKNTQSLLFKFDLSAFPTGSRAVSAKFSIYGSGGLAVGLNFFRMTSAWVEGTGSGGTPDGATWNTSNGSTAWAAGGNKFSMKLNAANSSIVVTNWGSFDATDIANSWLSGQYPNYGIIAESTGEIGSYDFTSSDSSDAIHRPKIVFNYLVPCGATGPVDTTHGTVTLSPIADSFNDTNSLLQYNNGIATTLKVYNSASLENRILTQFDTSSIPAGATIQSATLRMFVSAVGSATVNTKSIWVNAINEPWVEGAGNNTAKLACPPTPTAGTSWKYRTDCTNWTSNLHPPFTPQSWSTMAPMPTARTNHMVATVNNKIYTIGGYNPVGGFFNTVEEYDPATNTWATKAPMPTTRSDAAAAVVNGKIYVIGGTSNGTVALKTNEMFDPSSNTWTTKANMTTARKFLSATAAANNKIYAMGGTTTTTALKNNEEYDPSTNTWATKAIMPTARMYLSTQTVNGKIYAIGGWTGAISLTNNEVYDPSTNTWASKAGLPIGTDSMASAVLGNNIYLIAGMRSNIATNAVVMYDSLNNNFTNQLNYPVATNVPAAALVNGYIYSLGGDNGVSVVYQNHFKFDTGIPTPIDTATDESTSVTPLAANFTNGWINFELKPLVQEWVDGVRINNGVVIYTDVPDQFSINSRENSTKNPQLIVTY